MNKPEGFDSKYDKYYDYLQSSKWQKLRNERLKLDDFRCQICGSPKQLHVHHLFYPAEYGTENINDCITVCENCHGILETIKKKGCTTAKVKYCRFSISAYVRAYSKMEIYDFLKRNNIEAHNGIYVYFLAKEAHSEHYEWIDRIQTNLYGLSVVSKCFGEDAEIVIEQ